MSDMNEQPFFAIEQRNFCPRTNITNSVITMFGANVHSSINVH